MAISIQPLFYNVKKYQIEKNTHTLNSSELVGRLKGRVRTRCIRTTFVSQFHVLRSIYRFKQTVILRMRT